MCLKVHETWVMKTKEERIESCVNLGEEIEKEFGGKYCTLMLIIMVMLTLPHLEKFTFFYKSCDLLQKPTCICSKKLSCKLLCICFFDVTGF